MSEATRRVVISGMGVISPLGNSIEEVWEALCAGRSGVGPLTTVPAECFPTRIAAEARQFRGTVEDFGPLDKEQTKAIRKGLKVMCRECQMGVAAAQLALHHSGLAGRADPERTGICFGSDYMVTLPEEFTEGIRECLDPAGRFEPSRWPQYGLPKMSPLWLLKYLPNMPASHLAIYNDLRGPSNSITLREASAFAALGEARQTILRGNADVIIVGCTGTRLHPLKTIHATQQEELARGDGDPARASRPFDRHRAGMVLGEGAGAVVLEELQSARRRGAPIYAELLAGVSSSAVGARLVARRGLAMKNALRAVLNIAGIAPSQVGFVHAHGLSTRSCDIEEAQAIAEVFADRPHPVPVVAAKSYFGNLGAGSGIVECIASILALTRNRLFRTLNYETPDPDCPVAVVTEPDRPPGDCFVALSVTPQGQASAVLIRRCTE